MQQPPHTTANPAILLQGNDPIEQLKHRQEKRDGAVSLGISIGVTALLLSILAWWSLATIPENEVEIVIATEPGTDEPKLPKRPPSGVRAKPSSPSFRSHSTISAATTSPISVPSIVIDAVPLGIGSSIGLGDGIGSGSGPGIGDGLGPHIGLPPRIKGRCGATDRIARLRKAGGKAEMDRQVLKALRWLKDQQKEDGSFGDKYPVAMSSFALLAFSGHCETVDSPEFGDTVKKTIEYLVGVADKGKGLMSSTGRMYQQVSYEHGIAVYALAEAYSMNKNARKPFKRISPTLKKAVPIVIEGQTNGGGWLYSYGSGGTGDLSVAGWNMQALKAAELTGLSFSGLKTAMKKARRYLDAAEDSKGSAGYYRYRVRDGQAGKLSLTGVGVLCCRMMGEKSRVEDKALDLIISKAPKAFNASGLYAWYYHSQAAFQAQGKHWREYNDTYQKVITDAQEKDGSWPASAGHGPAGAEGKIYSTCLCTLMLEVYYRYLPATK